MFTFILRRLSLKLLIPLCLVIVAGIGGLVYYVTESTYDLAYTQAVQAAHAQAVSSVRSLTMFIKDQKVMGKTLAQHPDMLLAVNGAPAFAQKVCEEIIKSNPNLWGMVVFDATGTVTVAADVDNSDMVGLT